MNDDQSYTLLINQLREILNDDSIEIVDTLQSLWSGYGSIIRIKSCASDHSYIVKVIDTKDDKKSHPRGWNTSTSHQRKVQSYKVETNFYLGYSNQTDFHCKTPQLIQANSSQNEQQILVMEDLDHSGYFVRHKLATWQTARVVIKWLANFHAKFMQRNSEDLWQRGGYWHLATRQDEFNKMPDSELKSHTKEIDTALTHAKYQTLVHGDAKLENMCFHHTGESVAAVDFQYIGKGAGVIDLAYFMGSAFHQEQLFEYHEQALDFYLNDLKSALDHERITLDWHELQTEYRHLYAFAWADFHRFLIGWNPKSWKMNDYIKQQSANVIQFLNNKT